MGKETAVIKIPKGFDIWQTLNCGQCFRFTKRDDGVICGVLQNRSLEFKVDGDSLYINCEQRKKFIIFLILKEIMTVLKALYLPTKL